MLAIYQISLRCQGYPSSIILMARWGTQTQFKTISSHLKQFLNEYHKSPRDASGISRPINLYQSEFWGPFHKRFSIAIHIQWKFSFVLAWILTKWSLQNPVHDMTAVLSWHVQKFIAIWWPAIELQQGEVSLEFELRAKNCWWNESRMQTSQLPFL